MVRKVWHKKDTWSIYDGAIHSIYDEKLLKFEIRVLSFCLFGIVGFGLCSFNIKKLFTFIGDVNNK